MESLQYYINNQMEYKTNQQKIEEVLSNCHTWHYEIKKEQLNQLKSNRLIAIAELFSSAKSDQHLYYKFWNKSSSLSLHCTPSGTCQFVNVEEEKGLGCFIISSNQISVKYILYDSFNLDEEAGPIIHSIVFERNPDNSNYITFENMKLYAFNKLLEGLSYDEVNYDSPISQYAMDLVTEANSNTRSEIWNFYEYYEHAPKNSKTIYLKFFKDGHVTGLIDNICDGKDRGGIFGIYDVVGSEIKVKYFYLNSFVITRTIDLIDLNPSGKNAISGTSLYGIILCPFYSFYMPLWKNYGYYRAEDKNYIKFTRLLEKAMKSHYSKSKVFRSDVVKYQNKSFSRMCHSFTFFPNGAFLRESFTKIEKTEHKYANFGVFFLKEGQILTEFYGLGRKSVLEEQVITVISETQILIGDLILTENNGEINFSEKLSAILEMKWRNKNKITYEKLSIIESLVQSAEETNIKKSFHSSTSNNWDLIDRDIDFYPNGTCKLRYFSASNQSQDEIIYIGNYSVNNENEFTLRICLVWDMVPKFLVLTVGDTVTWDGITLNSVNL